ncbi:hypothetical protein llap_5932 [Limosa lapponica baueri]|uniref:Placenta-expressed transcript 1 protein n=1 Tax=Limosa lapponica baueri TaxID=1758121 RepID=A0A2I0UCJ9_LIMLA|nr:hypothetical protein llap_5932 [Limosa lapponica baueri]
MATFLFLVQLLFIGTLIAPAHTEAARCNLLVNASASNFNVSVTPEAYKANTTYQVTISNDRNDTDSTNVTEYLLQALSPQNNSIGEWEVDNKDNCNSIDTAVLNATQNAINWTSPNSNITSVEIRVYIIFNNDSVEFMNVILNKGSYRDKDWLAVLSSAMEAAGALVCPLSFFRNLLSQKAGMISGTPIYHTIYKHRAFRAMQFTSREVNSCGLCPIDKPQQQRSH